MSLVIHLCVSIKIEKKYLSTYSIYFPLVHIFRRSPPLVYATHKMNSPKAEGDMSIADNVPHRSLMLMFVVDVSAEPIFVVAAKTDDAFDARIRHSCDLNESFGKIVRREFIE